MDLPANCSSGSALRLLGGSSPRSPARSRSAPIGASCSRFPVRTRFQAVRVCCSRLLGRSQFAAIGVSSSRPPVGPELTAFGVPGSRPPARWRFAAFGVPGSLFRAGPRLTAVSVPLSRLHARPRLAAVAVACLLLALLPGAWMLDGGSSAAAASLTKADNNNAGVRTLYLIRHGQYDHEDDSNPDVGKALVPLGIAQARLVAARLRSLPVTMTSLHSSTMTRARQTALVIGEEFPELTLEKSRILRECTPPTWRKDIMAEVDPKDAEACQEQIEKAYAQYFVPSPDADRHDIIVCHGNVIRYFVTKVLGVDTMSWLRMAIGNCSLTVIRINADGTMKLLSFSDVGHLPPNMQTGLYRDSGDLIAPE